MFGRLAILILALALPVVVLADGDPNRVKFFPRIFKTFKSILDSLLAKNVGNHENTAKKIQSLKSSMNLLIQRETHIKTLLQTVTRKLMLYSSLSKLNAEAMKQVNDLYLIFKDKLNEREVIFSTLISRVLLHEIQWQQLLSSANLNILDAENLILQIDKNAMLLEKIDVNECATANGGCEELCRNTIGSFACFCTDGFTLQEDGLTCVQGEGNCRFDVALADGQFSSPNFPDNYPSRQDCQWVITGMANQYLELTFNDFDLEPQQDCIYDSLIVYDGDNTEAPILGTYCGPNTPASVVSSTNQMLVVFKSDFSVQREGFNAMIQGVEKPICGHIDMAEAEANNTFFSHELYGSEKYDHNSNSDWSIEAPSGHMVQLDFRVFELESDFCDFDFVEIFDGMDGTATSLGKFCGTEIPPTIVSSGRYLYVRFQTDGSLTYCGFEATYTYSS